MTSSVSVEMVGWSMESGRSEALRDLLPHYRSGADDKISHTPPHPTVDIWQPEMPGHGTRVDKGWYDV